MAIKIVLRRKPEYFTLVEEINTRIEIALDALQQIMIGEIFEPRKLTGWVDAPLEELGGKKIGEEPLSIESIGAAQDIRPAIIRSSVQMKDYSASAFGHSIFRIEGIWNLDGVKTEGFLSINNDPDWRSAYGDVDIDGYPAKKYDDFLDIFWDKEKLRNELIDKLFSNFVRNFASKNAYQKIFDIHWICFANGVPSQYELRDVKAVYYDNLKSLVDGMFYTFSERNKKRVQKSLSKAYLAKRYVRSKIFQGQMQAMIVESNVQKKKGSLILIANEKNSFAKLYDTFEQNYLDPLYNNLKVDDQVNRTVDENIIRNQAKFSDYQPLDEIFEVKEETDEVEENEE